MHTTAWVFFPSSLFARTASKGIRGNTEKEETVVLIINKNISPVNINLNRFEEIGLAGVEMKDILSNNIFIWGEDLNLPSKGVYFYTSKTE